MTPLSSRRPAQPKVFLHHAHGGVARTGSCQRAVFANAPDASRALNLFHRRRAAELVRRTLRGENQSCRCWFRSTAGREEAGGQPLRPASPRSARLLRHQSLAPVLTEQVLRLPRVHRRQPAGVGEMTEQFRGALGCEAQQTFAQGRRSGSRQRSVHSQRQTSAVESGRRNRANSGGGFGFVKRLV